MVLGLSTPIQSSSGTPSYYITVGSSVKNGNTITVPQGSLTTKVYGNGGNRDMVN